MNGLTIVSWRCVIVRLWLSRNFILELNRGQQPMLSTIIIGLALERQYNNGWGNAAISNTDGWLVGLSFFRVCLYRFLFKTNFNNAYNLKRPTKYAKRNQLMESDLYWVELVKWMSAWEIRSHRWYSICRIAYMTLNVGLSSWPLGRQIWLFWLKLLFNHLGSDLYSFMCVKLSHSMNTLRVYCLVYFQNKYRKC